MKNFVILIPVYNDWKSVSKLLKEIDLNTIEWDSEIIVIIINDGSTEKKPEIHLNLKKIKTVKILNMKKNQGHAKCLATGMKYIVKNIFFEHVILMDADGEDRPEELNLFFKKSKEYPHKVITAERIKRSEGPFFRFCYQVHKYLTYIFTGHLIKFGNYSCLPKASVIRIIEDLSIRTSFSGTLTKLFPDRISVPSTRSLRYFGPSKMNFFNLLIHSFSIIAVFKGTVFLRSAIFLSIYLFIIFQSLSLITLLPIFFVIALLLSVMWISNRENLNKINNSLDDISNVDNFN